VLWKRFDLKAAGIILAGLDLLAPLNEMKIEPVV
jgi:hypothetical protein